MTFRPANAALSREEILDTETDNFSFSDSTRVSIQDSAIRQVPIINIDYPTGIQWPAIDWDWREEFLPIPGSIDSGWGYSFTNFTPSNPVQWEFDLQNIFLLVETDTGEYFYLEQSTTGTTPGTFTNVDNATGYTLQLRIQVTNTDTGDPVPGHSLFINDGVASAELFFTESGIGIRDNTGAFLSTTLSVPREIRIGVRQNDIYIFDDNGYGYAGIDQFTGTSTGDHTLWIGNRNTGTTSTTYLDYFYQFTGGIVLDTGLPLSAAYYTGTETVTTPAFAPDRFVEEFSAAYVDLSIGLGGGTTEILPQYRSSTTSDTWTDFGDYITLSSYPLEEILLDNIPTAGDGTDELRFITRLASTDGSAEAGRIERISVKSRFTDAKLRGFPRWGPVQGGNTIALELHSTRGLLAPAIATSNTLALYRFDDTGDANTGVVDSTTNDNTGQILGTFVSGISSSLGTQIQLSEANIDTSSNLENIFDSTYELTGIPAAGGEIASGFTPLKFSSPAAGLYFEIVDDVTGATAENMTGTLIPAQKMYIQRTGDGVEIADFTTSGNDQISLLSMRLEIQRGTADIEITTDSGDQYNFLAEPYDYQSIRPIRFITHPIVETGQNTLRITNSNEGIATNVGIFTVSDFHLSDINTGSIRIPGIAAHNFPLTSGDVNSGWSIDMFVTPYAYNIAETGSLIFEMTGASESVQLTMNNKGYPIATIESTLGSTVLTGQWPLLIDERKNVAVTYYNRPSPDGYAAILVDGEVNALERSSVAGGAIDFSGEIHIGGLADGSRPYYGLVDQFRIRNAPAKPEFQAQDLGLTDIFFRDVLEVPGLTLGDNQTHALLHFNELNGPVLDDAEFWGSAASEAIIPHERRLTTTRGEQGVIGSSIYFTRTSRYAGGIFLPNNNEINDGSVDQEVSFFFYFGGYTDTGWNSELIRYRSDDNFGYQVDVNTSGYMEVSTYTGALDAPAVTHVHTGAPIGINQYVACGISFRPTPLGTDAVHTYVDGTTESTTAGEWGDYLQGNSYDGVRIGYGVMGAMDQFHMFSGQLSQSTFDIWRRPNVVKGLPQNEVYIGGELVETGRVLPVNPRKMYVVMPEGTAGETHVYINFNGISISMERPYKYVQSYAREIDFSEIEDAVCRTKSPFRIGYKVPDGSVGLSVMQVPDLTVVNNMSSIDLSDRELANISNHLRGQFTLTNPEFGADDLTYSGQIDTQEVVISNRSVMRRSFVDPAPLYYKYLLGRGRYYLKQVGATDESDIELIKETLELIDSEGNTVDINEYPWDIEISTLDINGNQLPENIFSVVVFTHKLYLTDKTVFMRYTAADAINRFRTLSEYREIINPVPIFKNEDTDERDSYVLTFTDNGTYDITIDTG